MRPRTRSGRAVESGASTGVTIMLLEKFLRLLIESFAEAISTESAEDRRGFFEALHRALVIIDDFLCHRHGFSRKARGKYVVVTETDETAS